MFYEQKVDHRSREQMVEFLAGHFRYNTMNSWNRGASYANRVKIRHLGLTREQDSKAYDILNTNYWDELRYVIDDFTLAMDGHYSIGTNGRSGGYLVLYRGEYYDPGYKSRCRACGQLNYQHVSHEVGQCGLCGKMDRVNLVHSLRWHRTTGSGIDGDVDANEISAWSMSQLRDRVELVCRFDRACDEMRQAFISLIEDCMVVTETLMVPKTITRLCCSASV
jgi:hypothetical protein